MAVWQDEEHIAEGAAIMDAAKECWEIGAPRLEAIGVNCVHPAHVSSLLKSIKRASAAIPLIAYPNSGETYIAGEGWEKLIDI